MLTTALFTVVNRWKQPKYPSTDKGINKLWYIHNEIFSVLKRKVILTHATTWMKLEEIMPSERSQSQKDKYCMILFV